nr:McrC family protein [Rhabdothermincola salaria]
MIELLEYESKQVALTQEQAVDLRRAGGQALSVSIGGEPGAYDLKADSQVGTVVAGDQAVLIRPKVPFRNLFYLLGVKLPDFGQFDFDFGKDLGVLGAMAAVFARAVEDATARGVYRSYRHTEDRLLAPRGRIDIAAQLRRPAMPSPMACRFDEFTSDVPLNQFLVAALERVRRVPGLPAPLRADLLRLMNRFDEVTRVPVEATAMDRWRPGRLDRHYRFSVQLAQLIMKNLSLADRHGSSRGATFLVDMPALFQAFVTQRLTTALRGRLTVRPEPSVPLGQTIAGPSRKLTLLPDLTFERHSVRVYVGDVKYKLSTGAARMGDYQQLLTYSTVTGLDEGILIYAEDPDSPADAPRVHTVRTTTAGTLLHTYRVPLAGSHRELEAEVVTLADWIAHRCGHSAQEAA